MEDDNYLHRELTNLMKSDTSAWEFIQAGSLDGVWYWDLENPENEWMSPEFWQLFGIDPETKTHSPSEWQSIIFKEDLARALKAFEAHCADPRYPYDEVVRYLHADGSTVWVRCRGLAIRDANGKPIRMLGAHNDLTQVKATEENARKNFDAATSANAELRSFAYSISHDMKAPVNTLHLLLSELSIASENALSEDAHQLLNLSKNTVVRMKSLVEDLLDYTRVFGMEPDFHPLALQDSVQDALSNLRSDIENSGATITVGDLPEINGAATQMTMLFQNLISNAIKFRKDTVPPQIAILAQRRNRVKSSDPVAHDIVITDNGIGIDKVNQSRIFKVFQRLHTHESYSGTGLGLPLCLRIANSHGGTITVDSDIDQGAKFIVTLPEASA